MKSHLDSLREHSLVVADTGDIDAVARWKPQDATTNPSLLLASAEDPRYRPIVEKAIGSAGGDAAAAMDRLFVDFGMQIARKGWLESRHVLNTRSVDDVLAFAAARRHAASSGGARRGS